MIESVLISRTGSFCAQGTRFLSLGAIALACSRTEPERGGLMILVTQDGPVDVARLDVNVQTRGKTLFDNSYRVPQEAKLPATIAVVSNRDETSQATVSIAAWSSDERDELRPLDRRDAVVTQIPSDRVALLRVVLSGRCVNTVEEVGGKIASTCPDGKSCDPSSGDCTTAVAVSGDSLGDYHEGDETLSVPEVDGGGRKNGADAGPFSGSVSSVSTTRSTSGGPASDFASSTGEATSMSGVDVTSSEAWASSTSFGAPSDAGSSASDAGACDGGQCLSLGNAFCKDEQTVTMLVSRNGCSADVCSDEFVDEVCEFGCVNGRCRVDPCAEVSCHAPPDDYCSGDSEAVEFDSAGVCVDGECVYHSRNVTCDEPPPGQCNENGTRTTYGPRGQCSTGRCNYESSFVSCVACSKGECYCPAGFAVGQHDNECVPCTSGFYSSQRDASACAAFRNCAPGEFVSVTGNSQTDRQCAKCEPGTYSSAPNATTCAAFTNCEKGKYVETAGSVRNDQACRDCSSGSFSNAENVSQCTTWKTCEAGQYVSKAGTSTDDRACSACSPGTFSTAPNAAACLSHTNCNPGFRVLQQGNAATDRTCTACTNGYSSTTNAQSCTAYTDCAPGKYVSQQGDPRSDRTCQSCPSGRFSNTKNVTSCTLFKVCGEHEVEVTAGTASTDRVCDCATGYVRCSGQCVARLDVTYYLDGDGDGWGRSDPAASIVSCSGSPSGYVANNTDCCDEDRAVHPNQSVWSTSAAEYCGGFDYNCDGQETQHYTLQSECDGDQGGSVGCSEGWLPGQPVPACGATTGYMLGNGTQNEGRTQGCR